MRIILDFNVENGRYSSSALPPGLEKSGGRALAISLAKKMEDGPLLIIAAGLLAGCRELSASRCSLVWRHRPGDEFLLSSAGGLLAQTLAAQGIAAIVLHGKNSGSWQDIIISTEGLSTYSSCCFGKNVSESAAALKAEYPDSSSFIVLGKGGESCLTPANLAFCSKGSPVVNHAGGGAGMVLGMMRVKALIVSLPSNYEHIHSENELCLQLKSFITDRILSSDIQIRCTGCTPGCLFSQSAIPPHKGRHAGKWPGYAKSWSTGKDEQDISNIRRFTSLCDEFGLDAFALATLLEEYGKNNGMLPDNAEELLDELDAEEGMGLIERIKMGKGRQSRIYVMRIVEAENNVTMDECEFQDLDYMQNTKTRYSYTNASDLESQNLDENPNFEEGIPDFGSCNDQNLGRINKNINKNSYNKNLIRIYPSNTMATKMYVMRSEEDEATTRAYVKEDIGTDVLCERFPEDAGIIRGIEDLLVDVLTSSRPKIWIGSEERDINSVKGRFMKLDNMLIEDVVASWKSLTEVPKNPRAYMLTMLYNVSTTHVAQIAAEVNHGMRYGFGVTENDNQELMEG